MDRGTILQKNKEKQEEGGTYLEGEDGEEGQKTGVGVQENKGGEEGSGLAGGGGG